MKMQQVSDHCFAVLNETNLVCDANSGLINVGDGVLVDTQSDLPHARKMIELFSTVWSAPPKHVVLTHEDIVNRPGSDGGSQSIEDESHVSTQEVRRRAA